MRPLARLLGMALGLAAAGAAQTQWLVGAGGYAQIRDVMPLVAPGDTVIVGPGTYVQFECTRGITIRAATPGTVNVAFSLTAVAAPCNCQCLSSRGWVPITIPAGQTAHVVGLSFGAYYAPAPGCSPFVIQQGVLVSGNATFDQCAIDCLAAITATVHLQDCNVTGTFSGAGLSAMYSDVTIAGGSISGAAANVVGANAPAWPAIRLIDSRLHACAVTATGGTFSSTFPGAPGISMSGGDLWLSDSTVIAGAGCAIEATGLVRIDRTALTTFGSGCASSPTGAPLVGVSRSGPLQIGTLFQVAVASQPGALVLVCGSTRLAAPLLAAIVEQPIWLDPTLLFLADAAVAPPSGQTTFTYQVPPIAALVGEQFWLQGFGGASFPLQTSPPVGGIVR